MNPYFQTKLGDFVLYAGDCREVIPRVPVSSVDVVFADVPCIAAKEEYPEGKIRVALSQSDEDWLLGRGVSVVKRDFFNARYPGWHEVSVLRSAFAEVL